MTTSQRRQRRKPLAERVEIDVWTRIANHLAWLPHPAPALEGRGLIADFLGKSPRARARRIARTLRYPMHTSQRQAPAVG